MNKPLCEPLLSVVQIAWFISIINRVTVVNAIATGQNQVFLYAEFLFSLKRLDGFCQNDTNKGMSLSHCNFDISFPFHFHWTFVFEIGS